MKNSFNEKLNKIWERSSPSPLYQLGTTLEEREKLIKDIIKRVAPLIPPPKHGHTPTEEELRELILPLLPTEEQIKGLIKPLIPNVSNGKTPRRGVDYFTDADIRNFIYDVIIRLPKVSDGKTPGRDELMTIMKPLIEAAMQNMQPTVGEKAEHHKMMEDKIEGIVKNVVADKITQVKRFGGGGSGDKVKEGDGIQISTTVIGQKKISLKNSASFMGVVFHNSDENYARPSDFPVVTWIGSVQPLNVEINDLWVDTS